MERTRGEISDYAFIAKLQGYPSFSSTNSLTQNTSLNLKIFIYLKIVGLPKAKLVCSEREYLAGPKIFRIFIEMFVS